MNLRPSQSYYGLLLLAAHVGLLIPPLRFPAALFLIGFLPGYLVVERWSLWKDPLFAAVGSLGLSFLLSPMMTLPGCLLFRSVSAIVILCSLDVFLLGLILFPGLKGRGLYETEETPFVLPLLLLVIAAGIFLYLDWTGLGPYSEDWIYLFAIVKELSRNMPPQDPEASFLLLKYPWFSYFYYALLHRVGGVSAWKVLEFVPVIFSFVFLGLVYQIVFQITGKKGAGIWAILLLTLGRESEWAIRGIQGMGWDPWIDFDPGWSELHAFTVYALLWGWYLLPNIIVLLFALFFLIRYDREGLKKDFWFSWGVCALSCFFHPAHYLGFMLGFSFWLFFQVLRKRFRPSWLVFYAAFLPYLLTFFLFLQPKPPAEPIYRFFGDWESVASAMRNFLGHNGIALPLAFAALFLYREGRTWLLPFAIPFFLLSVLGVSKVNQLSHVLFPATVYLSLLAGMGMEALRFLRRPIRYVAYGTILAVIIPPCYFHLSDRIRMGWEGALDPEQKVAGAFIRSQTEEDSIFLILPDSRYSAACVEGLGERKVVFGWFFHLNRYESPEVLHKVVNEVIRFFLYPDREKDDRFLETYQADYVFLGPEEKRFLRDRDADVRKFIRDFPAVYRSPNIEIFKIEREKDR